MLKLELGDYSSDEVAIDQSRSHLHSTPIRRLLLPIARCDLSSLPGSLSPSLQNNDYYKQASGGQTMIS